MRNILICSVAAAAMLSGAALANPANTGENTGQTQQNMMPPQQRGSSEANHQNNVVTISKLKQELQDAGFTDVQILADSFVVQAKDKDGNPTIMTLSPNGVVAFEAIRQGAQDRFARSSPGSQQGQPQTK